MIGPSLTNPWDLFYAFLKGSRASVTPAHKSQSRRASGRTDQKRESPKHTERVADSHNLHSGATQGQGGHPPRGRSPGLGLHGQPIDWSLALTEATSPATVLKMFPSGVVATHSFVRVL